MGLSAKFVRSQLNFLKPLMGSLNLESSRKGQARIGEIMQYVHRKEVIVKKHSFESFEGAWVIPKDKRRQGVILYLHGGGYACGDLDYALGFGSTLAAECGCKVFCAAYRLAPEHPFPAALEDAAVAYTYLLKKGYDASQIALCGESAGGGLCYSLCLKLKETQISLPRGIIAISPWTDLTASGNSHEINAEKDPSLSKALLDFFAHCYTQDRTNPMASPLFGDLTEFPPSLIFVGGDEILLDDSRRLHQRLLDHGCKSRLVVAPERWHGYVLYNLNENREDYTTINHFLNHTISSEKKLRWMRLDNAAKIYPASRSNTWSNMFRLSATLTEDVDTDALASALDITLRRFPSIAARLRKGTFWYYLQQLPNTPDIQQEGSYPLMPMSRKQTRQCAFRVIVYGKRVAVEFFHSLTDGTGGMIFLKTLLAEYLQQRYGITVPAEEGILARLEEPAAEELEDSFLRYAGTVKASRRESNAWRPSGTPEPDGYRNLLCLQLDTQAVLDAAHEYGVSLTVYLGAVMMQALLDLQREKVPWHWLRRPIKVQIPVNLRKLFPSRTLRNFALYANPEINPKLGSYSFRQICQLVHHQLRLEATPQQMRARITSNVSSERSLIVRVLPLFLKNIALKIAFNAVGEKKVCLSMSNIGNITLPKEMRSYVERMDFILAPQASAPHNCGVLSYNGTLYINLIRSIQEPELEAHFCRILQQQGLRVLAESNSRL